jgi:ubiquinone/menaquinone biosynthesis C-methylase UbiE
MNETASIITIFDEAADTYDNVGVDFFRPIAAELVRAVTPRPGDRVLDVGCGAGAVLLPVAEAVGPQGHVTGIDLAPGMVARTAAAATGLDTVTVELGDAQAPAYPPESFDLITSGLVLFFLPDPPAALAAYRELLAPGGRLGFTSFAQHDPRYPEAMKLLTRFADDPPPQRPLHAMFASAEEVRAATLGAGFAEAEVRDITVHTEFRDAAQLLEWIWSHAGRQLVTRIPPDRRGAATAALASELGEPINFHTQVRITVAHR